MDHVNARLQQLSLARPRASTLLEPPPPSNLPLGRTRADTLPTDAYAAFTPPDDEAVDDNSIQIHFTASSSLSPLHSACSPVPRRQRKKEGYHPYQRASSPPLQRKRRGAITAETTLDMADVVQRVLEMKRQEDALNVYD